MQFGHFIAGSCSMALAITPRSPAACPDQQRSGWFCPCPCNRQSQPGGREMVSGSPGWERFRCLAIPSVLYWSVLYWNVLRTTQGGCPSSWAVARHKTPHLLPRGIYCHWRGRATSILTSILLACPPHSSTAASLDPPCPAASTRSCKAPFPPDSQGQGCFPRLVCSPAVPLPEPIAPTKLPGNCQLLMGRRRDCWE